MKKSKANKNTPRKLRGFSTIELIITATILTIVTGLGLMGISRAKASVRLAGSAREYASYIEKARLYSIRSHADNADERASIAINDDKASYNVTMDLDGDGDMDLRTINLPSGMTFETIETIAFDCKVGIGWYLIAIGESSRFFLTTEPFSAVKEIACCKKLSLMMASSTCKRLFRAIL